MGMKGGKARKLKKAKLIGRPERTLFVKITNRVERSRILEILEKAHPEIEHVFLPRQKLPKFVYVLCKGTTEKDEVRPILEKLNNDELGPLRVFNPMPPKEKPEPEVSKEKSLKDPCCLLLEFIPKELTTETIEKEFPEAEKVVRFNKRRCYLHFKKRKDAMKARIRISDEGIAGHTLKVKFNKIETKEGKTSSDKKTKKD